MSRYQAKLAARRASRATTGQTDTFAEHRPIHRLNPFSKGHHPMRHAPICLLFALLTAFVSTLALSCSRETCDAPESPEDTTAAVDDDGCDLLNCGDYGACREPLPVCCDGKFQKAACDTAGQS